MKSSPVWALVATVLFFSTVLQGAPVEDEAPMAQLAETAKSADKSFLTCALCNRVVQLFFDGLESGATDDELAEQIVGICQDLNLYTDRVCRGSALLALPTLKYIANTTNLDRGNVCGILIPTEDCAFANPDEVDWTIPLGSVPKPPVVPPALPPNGSPTVKVLHIADVHWDPDYLEGTSAVCGEPLCCRADSPGEVDANNSAGYWGDYRECDMPWRTIEKAVAHMAQQHPDADYIIWTGDLVPHDVWSTAKEENLDVIGQLMGLMRTYFPTTPVYPTLGNHEAHPVNTFAPPEVTDSNFDTRWLYNEADRQWDAWLPAEASATIRYGGYYTAQVQPGLRIVSMNMNYCYSFNWWTLVGSEDPAQGLLWLAGVLQDAETNNEKVHILSHIPPGNSDCWTTFSREYTKIINRYESTVAAQFFGHTHNEEIKLFYESEGPSGRPTNVAFIGGSLTTYSNLNPGYRVYTVDGQRPDSTWAVLDHTTWIMNLTEANANASEDPVWFELYSARSEYGLADMSPTEIDTFYNRLVAEGNLFDLYYKNFYKGAEAGLAEECDLKCRADLLCKIVTTNVDDLSHCVQVKHRLLGRSQF